MAITDIAAARDAIMSLFKTTWDTYSPAPSPMPTFLWDNVKGDQPKDGDPFIHVRVQHLNGVQASLGDGISAKFRSSGKVVVAIRTPIGDGLTLSDAYVKVTQRAFEGRSTAPDGVLFRNVRVQEVGGEGDWYLVNVIADFEYDRVVNRS